MTFVSWFRPARPVPAEYRSNFVHLFFDIAWFGVLAGSAVNFVAVYAARQGASAFQIGLLNAGPAAVNLLITFPAGRWLETQPIGRAVFWTSVFHRFGYLFWVFLPLFLNPQGQIWALIGLILLASVPGTALAVGFNALFAAAVPPEWRGHVAGVRNALLSVVYVVTSLLCGLLLDHLAFPLGYQVVFAIGFLGAALSSLHLWFVRFLPQATAGPPNGRSLGDLARPGIFRTVGDSPRPAAGLRFLVRSRGLGLLRTDVLRGPFGRVVAVLFAFHLTQYLPIPLFPVYWVERLTLSDQEIGLGMALFYVAVFAGSTRLARLTQQLGNQRLTGIGVVLLSLYPVLTALAHGLDLFLIASFVGGLGWSLVSGALANYLLERVPADDRPAHLAWYNLALNAAVLLGSLGGPFCADLLGLSTVLFIFAVCRLLAALAILRWG